MPGKKLCVFHLPADEKDAAEFWKCLASYMMAIYRRVVDLSTQDFTVKAEAWIFRSGFTGLAQDYLNALPRNASDLWGHRGFVFPAMDGIHNFDGFSFVMADFTAAEFTGDALFRRVKFVNGAGFRFAVFRGGAYFGPESPMWAMSSPSASRAPACTSFDANASFQEAVFKGRCSFAFVQFKGIASFTEALFKSESFFVGSVFHKEVKFRNATCEQESRFDDATFNGGADLSGMHFEKGAGFHGAKFGPWLDFQGAQLGKMIGGDERAARTIRKLVERDGSYADAGDIYIIEMNFRRRRFEWSHAFIRRLLMELYRGVSRYGESPSRALFCLAILVLTSAGIYLFTGFKFMDVPHQHIPLTLGPAWPTLGHFGLALVYSFGNIVPGWFKPESMGPTSLATGIVSVVQAVFGIVILALFVLAVRRRFSR
jgi:uncharacterized protein YjbI with pentapeptide repeats